ncbi:MAG: nucleotidyltransferase domain-containing protein [Actinomycetaceae bacterium]|nr:nucleotidyltransferase domain-containing protein [Actinomycetaceae bacterium]
MELSLRAVRAELGWTQSEAAEFLGVSRRSYQTYEGQEDLVGSVKYEYMLEKLRGILEDENKRVLTLEQIQDACAKVFANYEVSYCYLFGSYAKGNAREDSDVDLLVGTSLTGLMLFAVVEDLRTALHKRVDALTPGQLDGNGALLSEVLAYGVKIYG